MTGGIYLIQENDQLIELIEQPYDSEALLQRLLANYPQLLAGNQINEAAPRRWLLVSREVSIPGEEDSAGRWSLDHLFLDQDAIPTLVEVKRSTDTRIRREVVGQMLDYAANAISYWPVETIRAKFETTCEGQNNDPAQLVAELIDAEFDDDTIVEAFWSSVKTNLHAGRVRLIFVADEIPPELRRIVEFLNTQMDPAEVLAVALKQYVGEGLRTLVPRVVGQTAEAQQKKSGTGGEGNQWDEVSFFQELEARCRTEEVAIAKSILEWAKEKMPNIYWGRGKRSGSFFPGLDHNGKWYQLIGVWTYGQVELQFQYMKSKPPFDSDNKRLELLHRWNEIPGFALAEETIFRRPNIMLSVLNSEVSLDSFLATLEWAVGEIRST